MRTLAFTFIGASLITALVSAQAPKPAAPAAPPAGAPAAASKAAAPVTAAQAESAVEPQGYTYNPDGRRDPFVSLLRRGTDRPKGPGLSGLGTAEVSLRGTLISKDGFVGILKGVDTKNYIVRVGDQLADGTIRAISADSMVIVQQVNDPLSLEKQREVRKLLRQTEEAK